MGATSPAEASDELPPEAYAAALAGLPRMGPARLAALLAVMSPPEAWASVSAPVAVHPGLTEAIGGRAHQLLHLWREAAAGLVVADLWRRIVALDVGVALHGSAGYPAVLADDVEPPTIVFHRGSPEAICRPRVALVGTRRCTSAGAGVAFELGRDLASAGVAVVSGLASGIDAAAHRGAVTPGGAPPIGVVATGPDVVYPPGQQRLWHQISDRGFLFGEAPPGTRPERWRFPARNRIIAALADVVVVVESHASGGALYTVDEADRRAVDVMAVPGSVRSPASVGTNNLLAEGRAPARDVGDVLTVLGLSACRLRPGAESRPPPAPPDQPVLDAVGWQPATLDHLVLRTQLPVAELIPALCRLVEAGWVAERGGWYERVADGRAPLS